MKIYLGCVLILTLDVHIITSSNLPPVPDTKVITPAPALTGKSPSPPTSATPSPASGSGSTEIITREISIMLKQSLTIYYDAMEENSQILFNTTLTENFDAFYPYIDFNYVPCQGAEVMTGGLFCLNPNDPTCQLNIANSCAIAQTRDRIVLSKFLMCTMKGTAALPDYNACASSSGIDAKKLQSCVKSGIGKQLCIAFKNQKPQKLNSLPGFIFLDPTDIKTTDSFDQIFNDACSTDFVSSVCGLLKSTQEPFPDVCNQQKLLVHFSYKMMDKHSYDVLQEWVTLYDKFSKFISIKFNPCMFVELNGDHLDCQTDADKDCVTGKTHACAVSLVKDEKALFNYIACSAKDPEKLPDFLKCATDNKIDPNPIKACVDSGQGTHLCFEDSKTRPSGAVPIVRFENIFNQCISTASWTNLEFVLCQQLKYYNLTYPDECKGEADLSIFYDSLDPEYQTFLTTTFMENYQNFANFVNFNFVPCRTAQENGNSVSCPNKLDTTCNFDKLESCTVMNFLNNDISLKILLCLSQLKGDEYPSYEKCLAPVKQESADLKTCAGGDEGIKLCLDNVKKAPPNNDRSMAFIFDDKFDEQVDKDIAGNFLQGLCATLVKTNKAWYPNDCYPEAQPVQ